MAHILDLRAQEGSSYIIIVDFIEIQSDGTPGTPFTPNDGLTWSLFDEDGAVINSRVSVPIASAQSVGIVLSGDDLLTNGYPEKRVLIVSGTYDSAYGNDIPLIISTIFQVEDLVGV